MGISFACNSKFGLQIFLASEILAAVMLFASPVGQIRLQNIWGDPGGSLVNLPQALSNLWIDAGSDSLEMTELLSKEPSLLKSCIYKQPAADRLVALFLKECSAKQVPGVYANGMQYCLAIMRRDLLRGYFSMLQSNSFSQDETGSKGFSNLEQEFALSAHEVKLCHRALTLQPMLNDFEFGPILVVPESSSRLYLGAAQTQRDTKMLVNLLKEANDNTNRLFSIMPTIVPMLECFFKANPAVKTSQIDEVAATYAAKIKRIPHPCLLWTLGYLAEEFGEDLLFRQFLQEIRNISGDVILAIETIPKNETQRRIVSVAMAVEKLLNTYHAIDVPPDIEVFVEFDH